MPRLERDDMMDIYELREALDGIAVRRVAGLADRAEIIAHLRDVLAETATAVKNHDLRAYSELDVQFHGAIWRSAGNHRLTVIAENLLGQQRSGNRVSSQAPGRLSVALREHADVVSALEAGDAERAAAVARHHVRRCRTAADAHGGAIPVTAPVMQGLDPLG